MIEIITGFFSNIFNQTHYTYKQNSKQCDEVINGSYKVAGITIDRSLCINGQATLDNSVRILKKFIVNGTLKAKKTTFESELTSNGRANLVNTDIAGESKFRGNLSAEDSEFNRDIEILSSDASFKNCKIHNITFAKLPKNNIIQKVKLTNNTLLSGDIIFKAGNGEVRIDSTSKVLGKIIGGKIINL